MNKSIQKKENQNIENYESFQKHLNAHKDIIRRTCASTLSDIEFDNFLYQCVQRKANPILGEVVAFKSGRDKREGSFSLIMTKAWYMKNMVDQPEYMGHFSSCVYPEDEFEVDSMLAIDGKPIIRHRAFPNKRKPGSKPVGAYTIIKKKSNHDTIEFVCAYVKTSEYFVNNNNAWNDYTETMIKKVSLVHCNREAFPKPFERTYIAEEIGKIIDMVPVQNAKIENLKNLESDNKFDKERIENDEDLQNDEEEYNMDIMNDEGSDVEYTDETNNDNIDNQYEEDKCDSSQIPITTKQQGMLWAKLTEKFKDDNKSKTQKDMQDWMMQNTKGKFRSPYALKEKRQFDALLKKLEK